MPTRTRPQRRSVADAAALDIAYQAGIVSSGKNLGKVAIIDSRGYDEQGIHYNWRSFSERERLDAEAGNHDNQVIWRYGTASFPTRPADRGGDDQVVQTWTPGSRRC